MMKAEMLQDRLTRCIDHDYKVHQKGAPTHKDCVVCALCRLSHELGTSFYDSDLDDVLKFAKSFGKKTNTFQRIEKSDAKGSSGKPVKRRRRSSIPCETPEHNGTEDSDSERTESACLPE